MKTIIEYTDSLDDQMALKRAMKSMDMASLLFEIQKNIKKRVIHTLDSYDASEAEYDLLIDVWERINEEFESHGIYIDELIS
jgi:5-carboxymethyl-2-hydroxymuconate isomerase